jgi:hypothetical protein
MDGENGRSGTRSSGGGSGGSVWIEAFAIFGNGVISSNGGNGGSSSAGGGGGGRVVVSVNYATLIDATAYAGNFFNAENGTVNVFLPETVVTVDSISPTSGLDTGGTFILVNGLYFEAFIFKLPCDNFFFGIEYYRIGM